MTLLVGFRRDGTSGRLGLAAVLAIVLGGGLAFLLIGLGICMARRVRTSQKESDKRLDDILNGYSWSYSDATPFPSTTSKFSTQPVLQQSQNRKRHYPVQPQQPKKQQGHCSYQCQYHHHLQQKDFCMQKCHGIQNSYDSQMAANSALHADIPWSHQSTTRFPAQAHIRNQNIRM